MSWYGMVCCDALSCSVTVVVCCMLWFWNDLARHLQCRVTSLCGRMWCGWVDPGSLNGRNHVVFCKPAWVPPDDWYQNTFVVIVFVVVWYVVLLYVFVVVVVVVFCFFLFDVVLFCFYHRRILFLRSPPIVMLKCSAHTPKRWLAGWMGIHLSIQAWDCPRGTNVSSGIYQTTRCNGESLTLGVVRCIGSLWL